MSRPACQTPRRLALIPLACMAPFVLFAAVACDDKAKDEPKPATASLVNATPQPSTTNPSASNPSATNPSAASQAEPLGSVDEEHDCRQHDGPPHVRSPGESATALSSEHRKQADGIRVSAHVGSVILRKQGANWVTAGKNGCTVPPGRIKAALDNLMALKATPSEKPATLGTPFAIQIDILMGELRALHLEVADHESDGDFARLLDDSSVILQGLDRGLWTADSAVWCANVPNGE